MATPSTPSNADFVRAVEAELIRAEAEVRAEFDRYMEAFYAELTAWVPKGLGPLLGEHFDGTGAPDDIRGDKE